MWHINYKIVDELRKTFPASYEGQLFFDYVPRKESYEIQYFFMHKGVGMRLDAEVVCEIFSTPYYYNWTDEDIAKFVEQLKIQVDNGIAQFDEDEDGS